MEASHRRRPSARVALPLPPLVVMVALPEQQVLEDPAVLPALVELRQPPLEEQPRVLPAVLGQPAQEPEAPARQLPVVPGELQARLLAALVPLPHQVALEQRVRPEERPQVPLQVGQPQVRQVHSSQAMD